MARLRAVFDASVLLRAAVDERAAAHAWIARADAGDIDATAPQLIWAEVAHTLLRYTRLGEITPESAQARLRTLLELRIHTEPLEALAPAVLSKAVVAGSSGYDAFYLVLAEALDATLVTADRKLAAAARKAELI